MQQIPWSGCSSSSRYCMPTAAVQRISSQMGLAQSRNASKGCDENAAVAQGFEKRRRTDKDCLLRAAASSRPDELEAALADLRSSLQHKSASAAQHTMCQVLDRQDSKGRTALSLACAAGSVACAKLLLSAGASPLRIDEGEQSCLHAAARHGQEEIVELLLVGECEGATQAGSQWWPPSVDGESRQALSPLHLAASRGHLGAVAALLRWGANPVVQCRVFLDREDEEEGPCAPFTTPLHLAAARGHRAIAEALLRGWARRPATIRGPDPRTFEDLLGRRPVDSARAAGHSHMLSLLDPSNALLQVLPVPQRPGFPSLAMLAAQALRTQLAVQLHLLGSGMALQQASGSGPGVAPKPAIASVPLAVGSSGCAHASAAHSPPKSGALLASVRQASAQQAGTEKARAGQGTYDGAEQSTTCPICLEECDQRCAVRPAACSHAVCLPCARQLCAGPGPAAVGCPMCRRLVGSWLAANS